MADDIAIKVDHVSKAFKLPHEKNTSVKSAFIGLVKGGKRSFERQQVLKDVSFEVKSGEFFGIVGRNGSGKSTLLKMLAGIYTPTKGDIKVNGKLTPFIELGVGFNPELTGRENVFLNGALLGFNRTEMAAMYNDIVEFAELERFMDQKLKNYSSGMQVRLAFSIAIRAQTDVLLIDEVLAVGDAAFQQKCYEFFVDMKKAGRTMILVTHDMLAVSRFCDRALLINNGVVKQVGAPKAIADAYLELNYAERVEAKPDSEGDRDAAARLTGASIKSSKGDKGFVSHDEAEIILAFNNQGKQKIHFGMQIFNEAGTYCFGSNSKVSGVKPTDQESGSMHVKVKLDLVPGTYTVTGAIMNSDGTKVLVYRPKLTSFRISQDTDVEGVANLPHSWSVSNV